LAFGCRLFGNLFKTFAVLCTQQRCPRALVGNPVQRGHRFQRKADGNPVIADSR
jgi:hypothetical protein